MKRILGIAYLAISVLFFAAAVALIVFAVRDLWQAIDPRLDLVHRARLNTILESIALLTIAVASLQSGADRLRGGSAAES